ncbi:MAG: F0F1 ATP synthase subunit B [Oscillospiraceae bacterium]|nr:F0F1 ATP synthase subunit B [Oscillospiraceae bacterium]
MQFEYQSLVAINPVTLIAQICNLFIQLFLVKKFFLDKIKAILDQRRAAADLEITDAQAAKAEAMEIKATYEKNMQEAKAQANEILDRAQKTATVRGEEIIRQANDEAAHIKQKAAADIAQEKKKVLNDAKNEISGIAMTIAEKVVERQLESSDHDKLINQFIDKLGD